MQPLKEYSPVADSYVFANEVYQVMVRIVSGDWLMLSIRRNDRETIMDWRDMQWIKNQLLGTEIEAVQVFPAESRLVDTSNQYWLFASVDPDFRFPFGFTQRMVTEALRVQVQGHGSSQQRPFADHVKPSDLEDMERAGRAMVEQLNKLTLDHKHVNNIQS